MRNWEKIEGSEVSACKPGGAQVQLGAPWAGGSSLPTPWVTLDLQRPFHPAKAGEISRPLLGRAQPRRSVAAPQGQDTPVGHGAAGLAGPGAPARGGVKAPCKTSLGLAPQPSLLNSSSNTQLLRVPCLAQPFLGLLYSPFFKLGLFFF